jgi:hypothetical protein
MSADSSPGQPLFASREPERIPPSPLPWMIAVAVIVFIAVALVLGGRHKAAPLNAPLALDPYAGSLAIDPARVEMSESTSLSGGKSTYIDGHIQNTGSLTVTAATLQVVFANDEAMPPQIETLPLTLIRTREPYVDTEPLSAEPLSPTADREFRLIFEDIRPNWNGQKPVIRVVKVATR